MPGGQLVRGHRFAVRNELIRQGLYGALATTVYREVVDRIRGGAHQALRTLVRNAANRISNYRYRVGTTASSLERKIGYKSLGDVIQTERRPDKRQKSVQKELFPKNIMSYSGYIQRDDRKLEYRLGRKLSRTKKVIRDLSGHAQTVVERCQNNQANAAADTPNNLLGAYVFAAGPYNGWTFPGNTVPDTQNVRHMPFYCFDLTSVYNNNRGATTNRPTCMYQLVFDNTGNPRFSPIGTRNLDDAATVYSWQVERIGTGTSAGLDVVGDKAHIDSVKANFSFIGGRMLPSTVYIELWTFTDKDIAPGVVTWNNADAVASYERDDDFEANRRRVYWVARMKNQLGVNNQMYGDSDVLKGAYIKRLKTLKFQPTSTTESDPNGHVRNVEMFIELNKTIDLRWPDNSADIDVNTELYNPDDATILTGDATQRPYPEYNRSTYLVLRADINQEHLSSFADPAFTAEMKRNLFPSFDFILRRYRTQIKI